MKISVQAVKDYAEAQSKCATEAQVAAAGFKIKRKYRPDGGYEWRAKFKTCDERGKLTADAEKYLALTRPGHEAHEARVSKINAKKQGDRAVLRAKDGSIRYVEPYMADEVARRNGWGHRVVIGGSMVRRYVVRGGKVVQVGGPSGD